MLLIITPNPALDRTLIIPQLQLGAVHRAVEVILAAGGKGLNVARVAQSLALPARVVAPLGGLTGQLVARLATAEGLDCVWTQHSAGETRTCVLLVDPQADDATALNEPGPLLAPTDWEAFAADVLATASAADLVALCGSLPPGVDPAALADLLRRLQQRGARVLVDTSGPALQAAITAAPYAVKVNAAELSAALNRPLADTAQRLVALAELRSHGIELAVVTLGAAGALASGTAGTFHAHPPQVPVVSAIGSGDALLAGLAAALLQGASLPAALRQAVACGTANTLQAGGGRLDPAEVTRLLPLVEIV